MSAMTDEAKIEMIRRMKAKRLRLGWSQQDLSVYLGVTWATVQRWEIQHGFPSRLALERIRSFLENNGSASMQLAAVAEDVCPKTLLAKAFSDA